MNKSCLNCGKEVSENFCIFCGQKNIEKGIFVRDLWNDFKNSIFGLDSPFWTTFSGLTTKPGKVSLEFINGKRKKYSKPIQYFLIALAFYFLIRSIFKFDPVEYASAQASQNQDRVIMYPRMVKVNHWMSRNVNFILPIWVLILSLADYLFFFKDKFRIAERMSHYFYAVAQYVFFSTLLIPAYTFFNLSYFSSYVILVLYMSFAIVQFHKRVLVWTATKAFIMTLLSFIIYVILAVAVVYSFFEFFAK